MPKPSFVVSDEPETDETLSVPEVLSISPSVHDPLYLDPESLIDAENVRPGETKQEHDARVKALVTQITADGQQVPIRVTEWDGVYHIVDGQGRADALRIINNIRRSDGSDLLNAWCVLGTGVDDWATAIKLNVQRKNYTDLQLAFLISHAREKYGWTVKGGEKKLAAFFGLTPQHLVEYNTIAAAPKDVKDRLASGEISKAGALQLISASEDSETRTKIADKAKEIATKKAVKTKEETDRKYEASRKQLEKATQKNAKSADKQAAKSAKPTPEHKPVKVQAKDIAEAQRQVAESAGTPTPVVRRNRTEILAALNQLGEFTPNSDWGTLGKAFLNGLLRFADGDFSPKQLQNRWNSLLGIEAKSAK